MPIHVKTKLIYDCFDQVLSKLDSISAESLPEVEFTANQIRGWSTAQGEIFNLVSGDVGIEFGDYSFQPERLSRYLETRDQDGRLQRLRTAEHKLGSVDGQLVAQPVHQLLEHSYLYLPKTSERLLTAAQITSYTPQYNLDYRNAMETASVEQTIDVFWFESGQQLESDQCQATDWLAQASSQWLSARYLDNQLKQAKYCQRKSIPNPSSCLDGGSATIDTSKLISITMDRGTIAAASLLDYASDRSAEQPFEGINLKRNYYCQMEQTELRRIDNGILAAQFDHSKKFQTL